MSTINTIHRYTAKRLTDEFAKKSWTKRDVNKLFKKWGTQAQLTGGQASGMLSFFFRSLPDCH